MSSSKLVLGVAAASVVGVAALGGAAYLLWKQEAEQERHESSRQVTLEVVLPRDQVGVVIGKGGENVKEIQRRTNTRIKFKDEMSNDDEYRVAVIQGTPQEAQLAEILIHQTVTNQPRLQSLQIMVPTATVGRIIGRNGERIRCMQSSSGCRVDVARTPSKPGDQTCVTLKGSSDQVAMAKGLIDEVVAEVKNRQQAKPPPLFLTTEPEVEEEEQEQEGSLFESSKNTAEELQSTSGDDLIEVYVSAISDPGHFYVQKVGPVSVELDKLVQDMTAFYQQDINRQAYCLGGGDKEEESIQVGLIVAAQLSSDENWYRARVVEINRDDYDESKCEVDVDFVDFGDCETKQLSNLCLLKKEFANKLNHQAIQATMADIIPANGEKDWSNECADDFERLTHAAQWKPLLAKVISHELKLDGGAASDEDQKRLVPCLQLVDTNSSKDVNIGQELVKSGHAVYKDGHVSPQESNTSEEEP